MKNLKRSAFGLSFLIALLCGCVPHPSPITPKQIEIANAACATNGGALEIEPENGNYNGVAKCNNGAKFMFNKDGILKK